MKAIVFQRPGEVAITDVPQPVISEPTDAIVHVTLAGICGTDLHAVHGDFPGVTPGTILGHEFVGEVAQVGSAVQRIRQGDRVLASDFTACGHCRWCDRSAFWQCPERAFFGTGTAFGPALDGAQAEYVRVPHADNTLGLMPAACPPEAGLLMADNLPTGWVAIERAQTRPGDFVVVIGGGTVGQLTALSAQTVGAGIVLVVEPSADRRAFAERNGALAATPEAAPDLVRQLSHGDGADIVIEAVGNGKTLSLGMSLVRAQGHLVSVGTHVARGWELPIAEAFMKEKTFSFAIGDAIRVRHQLLQVITSGALDSTVVIQERGTLADAPRLYARLARQEFLKAVVSP